MAADGSEPFFQEKQILWTSYFTEDPNVIEAVQVATLDETTNTLQLKELKSGGQTSANLSIDEILAGQHDVYPLPGFDQVADLGVDEWFQQDENQRIIQEKIIERGEDHDAEAHPPVETAIAALHDKGEQKTGEHRRQFLLQKLSLLSSDPALSRIRDVLIHRSASGLLYTINHGMALQVLRIYLPIGMYPKLS